MFPALSHGWEDLELLRKHWDGPIILKGIQTVEDAKKSVELGVSSAPVFHIELRLVSDIDDQIQGIVVSNHGGRQLNGALATIDSLPEIAEAIGGKIPIHVDGGIRHGTDIFKALALGADFCWVGRPALWGLAYKGSKGVELMLKILSDEVLLAMVLAGTVTTDEISKEYLAKVSVSVTSCSWTSANSTTARSSWICFEAVV